MNTYIVVVGWSKERRRWRLEAVDLGLRVEVPRVDGRGHCLLTHLALVHVPDNQLQSQLQSKLLGSPLGRMRIIMLTIK